jgi:hypothetical protein
MRPPRQIRHSFIELAPKTLEEGVLYVSVEYASAVHSCFCGCGIKVATPISPTDWKLTYDGDTVSLWPSVGNWDFPCRSHYFIERNVVRWAGAMTREEIEEGRAADRWRKAAYYNETPTVTAAEPGAPTLKAPRRKWSFLKRIFGGGYRSRHARSRSPEAE